MSGLLAYALTGHDAALAVGIGAGGAIALVFLAALGPVMWLVWAALTDNLSVNPLSDITNETGVWTIRFICITLALTPLRRVTGSNLFAKFRRMLGLYAFFYGVVHFASYIAFDHVFDAGAILLDIVKRPFITVGFAALLLMLPLAITRSEEHTSELQSH